MMPIIKTVRKEHCIGDKKCAWMINMKLNLKCVQYVTVAIFSKNFATISFLKSSLHAFAQAANILLKYSNMMV